MNKKILKIYAVIITLICIINNVLTFMYCKHYVNEIIEEKEQINK